MRPATGVAEAKVLPPPPRSRRPDRRWRSKNGLIPGLGSLDFRVRVRSECDAELMRGIPQSRRVAIVETWYEATWDLRRLNRVGALPRGCSRQSIWVGRRCPGVEKRNFEWSKILDVASHESLGVNAGRGGEEPFKSRGECPQSVFSFAKRRRHQRSPSGSRLRVPSAPGMTCHCAAAAIAIRA